MKSKAILIDAKNKTVTEVEVDGHKSIQSLIGCDMFTVAQEWPDDHTLFVNDGGWLPTKDAPRHSFFVCPFSGARYEHLEFAGNGILIRADDEGETIDVLPMALTHLKRVIEFPDEEITDEKRAEKLGDGFKIIEIEEAK